MTIKELYEKAVEGGYENLPLYDRIYVPIYDRISGIYGKANSDIEIDADSIQVEDDKVIFV